MSSAPVITFRDVTGSYSVLASLAYVQSTLGGNNLPVLGGENSNLVRFRIYNNFALAANIATINNMSLTVFDGADPSSHNMTQSPVSQSWVRVYETGYGENSSPPGLYSQFLGEDTAIGRAESDVYVPEKGSDGTANSYIRAGTNKNGVGFIEFASYVEAPDVSEQPVGFASYMIAVSLLYEWTS